MYTSYPDWTVLKKEGVILFAWLTLVLLGPQNSLENRIWGLTSELITSLWLKAHGGWRVEMLKGRRPNFFPDAAQLGSYPINIEEILSNI